jgi:hypothetical protein
MQLHSKILSSLFVIVGLTTLFAIRGQHGHQIAEAVDVSNFPIFDYATPRPTNPSERVKREAKGKKYNSKYAPPITESTDQIYAISDWDVQLPAFPVTKSSGVIIGEIVDAQAYLSEDLTKVYSEFVVRVNEVFKNDSTFKVGDLITVERLGGRVRFLSGKIVSSMVSHQDMPRVGGQYVLFLTHNFPMGGEFNPDLFVLTGYELRGDRVFPLDKTLPGHPITAYKGTIKESFMKDLMSALENNPLTIQQR